MRRIIWSSYDNPLSLRWFFGESITHSLQITMWNNFFLRDEWNIISNCRRALQQRRLWRLTWINRSTFIPKQSLKVLISNSMSCRQTWQNRPCVCVVDDIFGMTDLKSIDFLHPLDLSFEHGVVHILIFEHSHYAGVHLFNHRLSHILFFFQSINLRHRFFKNFAHIFQINIDILFDWSQHFNQ